jgi:ABC-type transport system involved in Fe-S cluster assembly fused permease/ATPase subunit
MVIMRLHRPFTLLNLNTHTPDSMYPPRYDASLQKYEDAATKTFSSLSLLNFGQSAIFSCGVEPPLTTVKHPGSPLMT